MTVCPLEESKKRREAASDREVTFADDLRAGREFDFDRMLSLDAAMHKLYHLDERRARIVARRFFAGFTVEEIATLFDVSKWTVDGDRTDARAKAIFLAALEQPAPERRGINNLDRQHDEP